MRIMSAILLTGDVMIGRGIDQILPHSISPELYEPFVESAETYVALAERANGAIPRSVPLDYLWGDALAAMRGADLCIVNLETALTRADKPAPKSINYRCHPANVRYLTAAGVDCCVLANNHVLDWREAGLIETLETLEKARLPYAGAGRTQAEAEAPAILPLPGSRRALLYAFGSPSSGVPPSWAATPNRPGVNLLGDHDKAFDRLQTRIAADRRHGDLVIVSIHWGPNWGYDVDPADHRFARRLIDELSADIVHGHSSHHPKPIETYKGKPILHGCGDFLNDYEGISGHEEYRPELVLAYLVDSDQWTLELLPFRIARFRLNRASRSEAEWLAARLDLVSAPFGTRVVLDGQRLRVMGGEQASSPRRGED